MQRQCECAREYLKELSGLNLEWCEREENEALVRESEIGADIGEDASRDGRI